MFGEVERDLDGHDLARVVVAVDQDVLLRGLVRIYVIGYFQGPDLAFLPGIADIAKGADVRVRGGEGLELGDELVVFGVFGGRRVGRVDDLQDVVRDALEAQGI